MSFLWFSPKNTRLVLSDSNPWGIVPWQQVEQHRFGTKPNRCALINVTAIWIKVSGQNKVIWTRHTARYSNTQKQMFTLWQNCIWFILLKPFQHVQILYLLYSKMNPSGAVGTVRCVTFQVLYYCKSIFITMLVFNSGSTFATGFIAPNGHRGESCNTVLNYILLDIWQN